MNKEIEKQFKAVIKELWEKGDTPFYVQNYAWDWVEEAIGKATKQERKRITSIVHKEIVKSDKYQIAPLQRIMCEINKI